MERWRVETRRRVRRRKGGQRARQRQTEGCGSRRSCCRSSSGRASSRFPTGRRRDWTQGSRRRSR
eukprot:3719875-Rhodomonas_salina.1